MPTLLYFTRSRMTVIIINKPANAIDSVSGPTNGVGEVAGLDVAGDGVCGGVGKNVRDGDGNEV
jgi:hypothetical protein